MNQSQTIANRFTISDLEKNLLGFGGMARVYLATDTRNDGNVAVKVLNPAALALEPGLLERFEREGEALRQLNHPNIVRMVAAVSENGQHYLVMEYVEGGSLQALLASQGRLPASKVIKIALEVADALTRAHLLGILHRDIKPANILLATDGTPRLTDFGIASIAGHSHLTSTGMLVGTIDYLSPEACQGQPLDERSDIWAFGVTLFELLTGQVPFKGANITATLTAILTQPTPDLAQLGPEIPDALADLVYRMLEKDPQQRIPSVRLVGADLEAILRGRKTSHPPVGETSKPGGTPALERFASQSVAISAPINNLPVQPTPFVGRQAELTELSRLLVEPDTRLVTILGMGGMGKTRLALETGSIQLDDSTGTRQFKQGVCFVALAPLQNVSEIIPAVAAALGFSFSPGGEPRQQLLDFLRPKSLLLILDNFEHVLEGVELVTAVLETAPQVKMLATTRVRLNVQGEQLFRLNGMEFPDWQTPEDALQYSAVKLFMQGARRVQPGFKLETSDLTFIARICRQVEGMPLGILLAAAWIDMLTPREIADEIARNFDFLESGQRDLPERHRSMRAVFNHSWNLLGQRDREVFSGLSVFRGGFTRQAAQEVLPASLRELMSLVDRSLLQRAPTGRYEVHELLRQLAGEQLANSGREPEIRKNHLLFFTNWAETTEPELYGPQQGEWLDLMRAELDNFRTALEWALKNEAQTGLRLASALWWFWTMLSYENEGRSWLLRFIQHPDNTAHSRGRGHALGRLADLSLILSNGNEGKTWAGESLQIGQELQDKNIEAFAQFTLGRIHYQALRDFQTGRQYLEKSLENYQSIGDHLGMQNVLYHLGNLELSLAHPQAARSYIEKSLEIAKNIGNVRMIAHIGAHLASFMANCECDINAARKLAEDSIAILSRLKLRNMMLYALTQLSTILVYQGNFEEANHHLGLMMEIANQSGNPHLISGVSWDTGYLKSLEGQDALAESLIARSQSEVINPEIEWMDATLAYLAARQGDLQRARRLLDEHLTATNNNSGFYSMLLVSSGYVSLLSQDIPRAQREYRECLEILWKEYSRLDALQALQGFAWSLTAGQKYEQAARLLGAAAEFRKTIGAPVFPGDKPYHERVLVELREKMGDPAFTEAWEAGRTALDFDRAVESALRQQI